MQTFLLHTKSTKKTNKNKTKKQKKSKNTILINVSWMFSLLALSSRIISDDKTIFNQKWQNAQFKYNQCPFINVRFICRLLFRLCDIIGRISLLTMSWVAINGYFTFVCLIIDFIIVVTGIYYFRKYVFFFVFFF